MLPKFSFRYYGFPLLAFLKNKGFHIFSKVCFDHCSLKEEFMKSSTVLARAISSISNTFLKPFFSQCYFSSKVVCDIYVFLKKGRGLLGEKEGRFE